MAVLIRLAEIFAGLDDKRLVPGGLRLASTRDSVPSLFKDRCLVCRHCGLTREVP